MKPNQKFYMLMPIKVIPYVNMDQKWIKEAEEMGTIFFDKDEAQILANQVNKFFLKTVKNYTKESANG